MLRNLSAEIRAVETQHKARIAAAKAAVDAARAAKKPEVAPPSELPAVVSNRASVLHEWREQLMMLEQQNKIRLARETDARQEREASPKSLAPVEVEAPVSVKTEQKVVENSGMIFPKLEKESPVSSTHDVTSTGSPSTSKAETAPLASPSVKADQEIFDDAESVDLVESSDDDGFLTDEEYDILDASDEDVA